MPTPIDRTRRGWPWQVGANGEVLKVVDGWPTWDAESGGGGGGGGLTRATFIGGQTSEAVIFTDDSGLRVSAEFFTSALRTARCALVRGPSGKWYFEAQVNALGTGGVNTPVIGVCQASQAQEEIGGNGLPANGSASWGLLSNGSGSYHNGNINTYGSALAANDVVMVAVDLDADRIWWGRNGSWFNSGNPSTGANPAYSNVSNRVRPAVSLGNDSEVTFRLDASSFSYSPPSGFSAWA